MRCRNPRFGNGWVKSSRRIWFTTSRQTSPPEVSFRLNFLSNFSRCHGSLDSSSIGVATRTHNFRLSLQIRCAKVKDFSFEHLTCAKDGAQSCVSSSWIDSQIQDWRVFPSLMVAMSWGSGLNLKIDPTKGGSHQNSTILGTPKSAQILVPLATKFATLSTLSSSCVRLAGPDIVPYFVFGTHLFRCLLTEVGIPFLQTI